MRSLRSINLNLLPILRELLRLRNVTHAAHALNMSQSAVSEALGRLRQYFNDPLLVKRGKHHELTALAERIRPSVEENLASIEQLICDEKFNPVTAKGILRMATVDYIVFLLRDFLIPMVAEHAPGITLQFVDFTGDSFDALLRGQLDFVIGPPFKEPLLDNCVIAQHESVCIVAKSTNIGSRISEDQFWGARHIAFSPGSDPSQSLHIDVLRSQGKHEFNAVIAQSFLLLPFLVGGLPDTVAIVARPLAQALAEMASIKIVELPFDFPAVPVTLHWERAQTHNPLLQWFRQLLTKALDRQRTLAPA